MLSGTGDGRVEMEMVERTFIIIRVFKVAVEVVRFAPNGAYGK